MAGLSWDAAGLTRWDEGLHPRAPDGRFGRKPGGPALTLVKGGGWVAHDREITADAQTASPEKFSAAFEAAFRGSPFTAFVNHYSPAQMRAGKMTPVLIAGGKAGILIHDHGDGRVEATAVFNTSGRRGAGLALLRLGVEQHGVNYVECFGPALPELYGRLGFADTDVYPFDPAQEPPGWDHARFDEPDYHLMKLPAARQRAAADPPQTGVDLAAAASAAEASDPGWWAAYGEQAWRAALAVFGVDPPAGGGGDLARFSPAEHRDFHGRWTASGDTATFTGSLGIDRKNMPQLSGTVGGQYVPSSVMEPKFIAYLRAQGITVQRRRVNPASLKPTQTTGDVPVIRGIADALKSGKLADTKPITVSKDGHVLDGHHTWAGRVLAGAEGGRKGLPAAMRVVQVGLPMSELLKQAERFGQIHGLAPRAAGVMANPAFARRAYTETLHPRDFHGRWGGGGAPHGEAAPAGEPAAHALLYRGLSMLDVSKAKRMTAERVAGAMKSPTGNLVAAAGGDVATTWQARGAGGRNDTAAREAAVSSLITGWARSSNDESAKALAIQEAARAEFSLGGTQAWSEDKELKSRVTADLAVHGRVYRDLLRAQYDLTQSDLRAAGITSLRMYRGFSWSDAKEVPSWGLKSGPALMPPLRPLSSWSTRQDLAERYAGETQGWPAKSYGTVMSATIPASAVLSTARSGFGSLAQQEFVTLAVGGEITVRNTRG